MDEVEEYIYTPQSPKVGNRFTLKTGSPDAGYVAPDALHRAFGDLIMANCTCLTQHRTLLPSVRCSEELYTLPEFRTGHYPVSPVLASGDLGHVVDLLGFRTGRYLVRLVLASDA